MARMHTCTHIRARDCLRYDFKYTYENACQLSFSRLIYDANGIAWRGVAWHDTKPKCTRNGGNVIGAFMSHSIASNSFSRIIIVIYREMAFLVPLSICRNGFVFHCFALFLSSFGCFYSNFQRNNDAYGLN